MSLREIMLYISTISLVQINYIFLFHHTICLLHECVLFNLLQNDTHIRNEGVIRQCECDECFFILDSVVISNNQRRQVGQVVLLNYSYSNFSISIFKKIM